MFSNPKIPKNPNDFFCEKCNYITSNKKDFNKHCNTRKHFSNNSQSFCPEKSQKSPDHICVCGKAYRDNSGLWRHKKKCDVFNADNSSNTYDGLNDKELILELLSQNRELQKSIVELSKEKSIIYGNNETHTNSHNKTFNLQFFLNDTCKNAMNLSEFISSIKPQLSDLETTGRLGYVEGISNIILTNLRTLQIHDRPLHCSDCKREVIYIKDNDQWTKENEDKPILTKAIKLIANENIKNISNWKNINPDCIQSDSRKNDFYLRIVSNSMSGSTKEETNKNITKIISNIAKEVAIDKKIINV